MTISIPKTSGIYVIKCEKNGKIYVGSSVNLRERWNQHRRTLKSNSHSNKYLQRAWNKYGEKSFKYHVLEICDKDRLNEREQHWLDVLAPYNPAIGYNVAVDAEASARGIRQTPEHRAKISAANKGKKRDPEKIRRGFKISPDQIEKMAAAKRGRKLSPETVEKMRQSNKGQITSPQAIAASRAICEKRYIITFPDGEELEIKGLNSFCREHNLNAHYMIDVAKGRIETHKGFKCRYVESTD